MATAGEDLRERLEGLRDRLLGAIDGAADRDLAPLAARYQAVLTELARLPDPKADADTVEQAQAETQAKLLRLAQ